MFKQLKIRAYLRTGVISDQYLPLDAVLYYHAVRAMLGEQIVTKPNESSIREGIGVRLPLKKGGGKDEKWYYNCSFAQWPINVVENSSFKVKQSDWLRHSDYYNEKKKIEIKRGKHKPAHIKLYYRHAEYVDWYCIGDPFQIAELLKFCTNLGKNSGDGWGEVLKWEIKDWSEDWSVKDGSGKLTRAVPVMNEQSILNKGGRLPSTFYGIRPSYWNDRHIFRCFMSK
jgi:CRISPR type IV-associated protein Csf3